MSVARDSRLTPERALVGLLVALALFAPLIFSEYWVATLLTQTMFLGIVAASLIFLSAYGGMVSLAQVAIYGIAGFALGNLTTTGNTKGLNLGWDPVPGIIVAIVIAVVVAFVFGALASRSYGIYFLMITLVFSVIANLFFGQVTSVSGFGGISGIPIPDFLDRTAHPDRLYFATLLVAALVYLGLRYVARTPFGLTLQGIRDDPVRMRSLGYRVTLHRLLAFGFAGFVAALGGILFVWWNAQIAPSTIDLGATIDVLLIAVIGGMFRLEGAWIGALVFVLDQQLRAGRQLRKRSVPHADRSDLPDHRARVPRRPGRPVGPDGRAAARVVSPRRGQRGRRFGRRCTGR